MRRGALIAAALAALVGAAPATAAAPLAMGFFDGAFSGANREIQLQDAASAGAGIVRIDIGWPAARRPAHPPAPADPAYDFSAADASIRAAKRWGLSVLVSFTGAPSWAHGPNPPADVDPATWRPDPAAVGAYGAALARRYDGRFSDASGHLLPRVRYFQLWNEPNLP